MSDTLRRSQRTPAPREVLDPSTVSTKDGYEKTIIGAGEAAAATARSRSRPFDAPVRTSTTGHRSRITFDHFQVTTPQQAIRLKMKHDSSITLNGRTITKCRLAGARRTVNARKQYGIQNRISCRDHQKIMTMPCSYCGTRTSRSKGSGLDRIRNRCRRTGQKLPYRTRNVVPACYECNMMRGTLSINRFYSKICIIKR